MIIINLKVHHYLIKMHRTVIDVVFDEKIVKNLCRIKRIMRITIISNLNF